MWRLVLVSLVLACNTHSPQGRSMKATHQNGLSFVYDERVREIAPLPDGFTLQLAPANARAVKIIVRVQDEPVAGADAWQDRTVDSRTYRFSEDRFWGGSGGEEYTLAIVTPVASKWVVLEQHLQTEATPSFDLAWLVMETAALH